MSSLSSPSENNTPQHLAQDPLFLTEEDLPDHHFRTELPNIIFELNLSPEEFKVYAVLKRIAGDRGACWMSQKKLSEMCGIGITKLKECMESLASPNIHIGDKRDENEKRHIHSKISLITITRRKKLDGGDDTNLIRIVPIWRLNGDYFRAEPTTDRVTPDEKPYDKKYCKEGGGRHAMGGGSPRDYKQDLNKEDLNKDNVSRHGGNVDNPKPKKTSPSPKKTMPSSVKKQETLDASRRWKLTPDQLDTFNFLDSCDIDTDHGTKAYWAKKYSLERIIEVYEESKASNPRSMAAYMQKLLKSGAIVAKGHAAANKEFAEDLKRNTGWQQLEIMKKYVKVPCGNGTIELDFNMQPTDFAKTLMNKHTNRS